MDTKDFLKAIHGEDRTHFRLIGDFAKNIEGNYEEVKEELERLNARGLNVYFTVNSGGTKQDEINKINAVFIDLDRGRNTNNEYYSLEEVSEYKHVYLQFISKFTYKPSFIIETRNGLHVYWLVNDNASIVQFHECQIRLINYFNSDEAVRTPERIMRLPGFNWTKDKDNPFMCNVIQYNDVRYEITDIINALPEVIRDEDMCATNKHNNNIIVSISSTHIPTTNNIDLVKEQNIEALQAIIQPKPVSFGSHDEVYEYLKKQDLQQFLGLPKKFNCIFHDDKNPSANIYQDNSTSYYWYKCFSSNCGVTKDIISITESILKCSTPKALRFLRKVYKIDYIETDWQKHQKEIFEENKKLLSDGERFRAVAPKTYAIIRNYLHDLIVINHYAKEKVVTERFTDRDGNPIFYVSISHLCELCKNGRKRITDRIGLFTYLGLIRKLKQEEIPDFLLREAKHQAKEKGHKNIVSYYSIPSYCDATLMFSEYKAQEYRDNGLTIRGWGRELILRTFGEDEANRVYPQVKNKQNTWFSEAFAIDVEDIIMEIIDKKGFTTEKEIIKQLSGYKELNKTKIKRVLPQIIKNYNLQKLKINKELKEKYRIADKGYPYIIVKNS